MSTRTVSIAEFPNCESEGVSILHPLCSNICTTKSLAIDKDRISIAQGSEYKSSTSN